MAGETNRKEVTNDETKQKSLKRLIFRQYL